MAGLHSRGLPPILGRGNLICQEDTEAGGGREGKGREEEEEEGGGMQPADETVCVRCVDRFRLGSGSGSAQQSISWRDVIK